MRQDSKIEERLEEKKIAFEQALREEKMKAEVIDVTLPGQRNPEWDIAIQTP